MDLKLEPKFLRSVALAMSTEDYGNLRDNFLTCADLWNAYIKGRTGLNPGLSVEDVAIMNIMIKIARLSNNITYKDGWVDIAGYAALGGELAIEN